MLIISSGAPSQFRNILAFVIKVEMITLLSEILLRITHLARRDYNQRNHHYNEFSIWLIVKAITALEQFEIEMPSAFSNVQITSRRSTIATAK
jgi:hypothetical protein